MKRKKLSSGASLLRAGSLLVGCCLVSLATVVTHSSTAYGSINNFDVVNDTEKECHGFEIEIEDLHSRDITYTYNWNHYGTPKILEDNSDPVHPKVVVRYASAKNPDGTWGAYTAIPAGPIAPTDGHRFTDPSVNFGGEHFGVGFRGNPTNITYFWLVDNGAGELARGPQVLVSTPTFNYFPADGGAPAQVQAVIEPAPAPRVLEFGPAVWVKEIRTTTHNNNQVALRDLVSDDPEDDDDRNWRNGEPDEVEIEWELLQEEFKKDDGGAHGELVAAPEDLPGGDEVVTRRWEFYKYVGPLDEESGEAMADNVGADDVHGDGIKIINGVEVDLSKVEVVGEYLGSQMAAVDVHAPVGLIEQVQDAIVDEAFPTRTIVIGGALPFTATRTGNLPVGMSFDPVSGELSGTPVESGVFSFTIEARAGDDPVVRRTYTLTVAEAAYVLPPRSTIDTVAAPLESGTTAGDGTYENGTTATVTATPAAGLSFAYWTEHGEVVSRSASYTFTNIVNRSLVARFVPTPPALNCTLTSGQLTLSWSSADSGFVLETNTDLASAVWSPVSIAPTVTGTTHQLTMPSPGFCAYFRLVKP